MPFNATSVTSVIVLTITYLREALMNRSPGSLNAMNVATGGTLMKTKCMLQLYPSAEIILMTI
jgi:hypothetical protein